MSKMCVECGRLVPKGIAGLDKTCSYECAGARERRRWRVSKYGLSLRAYEQLWEIQGGRCAICGKRDTLGLRRELVVDHDHSCCPSGRSCGKCVRGLLCGNCNKALGGFGDSVHVLRKAIRYLEDRSVRKTGIDKLVEDVWGTAWVNTPAEAGCYTPGTAANGRSMPKASQRQPARKVSDAGE